MLTNIWLYVSPPLALIMCVTMVGVNTLLNFSIAGYKFEIYLKTLL